MCRIHRSAGVVFTAALCLVAAHNAVALAEKSTALLKEIDAGRRAADYGRFSEAETCFLRVDQEAGSSAPGAASLARLNLALLYKRFGSLDNSQRVHRDDRHMKLLDKARQICLREIAACDSRRTADLVPFRIVLAGIDIFEGKNDDAEREVSAAQAQIIAGDVKPSEVCELRHLGALLQFLRFTKTLESSLQGKNVADPGGALAMERIAAGANSSWQELLSLQLRYGDTMGAARTHLYLSQLDFIRWQGRGRRAAAAELESYRSDLAEYQARCERRKTAVKKYRRDRQEQKLSFARLSEDCAALNSEHDALKKLGERLAERRASLVSGRDGAWGDLLPGAPQEGMPEEIKSARRNADRAADLLEASPIYPNLHYAACCHRATVLRAWARWEPSPELDLEIERCLLKAVSVLEEPRISLSGTDDVRAEFFFQYTLAFDQLIEWYRLHNRPHDALTYAELCRNRSLFDWIGSNSGDGQQQQVMDRLRDKRENIASLGRRLQAMPQEASEERKNLRGELQAATQAFIEERDRLRQQTAAAKAGFGTILTPAAVGKIIDARIHSGDLMLYYHVGARNSYLFVIGLEPEIRLYRLGSNAPAADRGQDGEAQSRNQAAQSAVTAGAIEDWVKDYVDLFKKPGRFPAAGQAKREVLDEHAIELLPKDLRQELADKMRERHRSLIISANGALQEFPFEALWVEEGRAFLLDSWSPYGVAYTPSLAILAAQEKSDASTFRPSLLTAACSTFPSAPHLENLPLAIHESDAIAERFREIPVHKLQDERATKDEFLGEMNNVNPACVHLATHSFAPGLESAGALAFHQCDTSTPPRDLLTIGEISGMNLSGCRLAVLSACRTNIGTELRGEMSSSIARAFLAARAHRVVASQWPVNDAAACEFATSLLGKVAGDWNAGQPCDYAAAVSAARQTLKAEHPDDPFYWAPFVLIGPPRDASAAELSGRSMPPDERNETR